MRACRWAAWAIIAVVSIGHADADRGGPLTLDQLMATLRTVRHVDARYIERRTLQALRAPLETRGALRFDAPDQLQKIGDTTASGAAERLSIKGDQLTIDRGGGNPIVMTLHDHPDIGVLVESLRATLSGNGDALRRTFDISVSGTIDHWQLVLQPRDAGKRDLLLWMRVSGYAERITEIDTQDQDGDRSEMSIVESGR